MVVRTLFMKGIMLSLNQVRVSLLWRFCFVESGLIQSPVLLCWFEGTSQLRRKRHLVRTLLLKGIMLSLNQVRTGCLQLCCCEKTARVFALGVGCGSEAQSSSQGKFERNKYEGSHPLPQYPENKQGTLCAHPTSPQHFPQVCFFHPAANAVANV